MICPRFCRGLLYGVKETVNQREYVEIVEKRLSPDRFEHSLRVVETALKLAEGKKIDREKVYLAALLHDLAKDMREAELLKLARENGLITCPAEERQPDLLHGPVGAWLCREQLGIKDEEVLQAIRFHSTGKRDMGMLDIIIYLADLIEPGRSYPRVNDLRAVCKNDLMRGLLCAFDFTLLYVLEKNLLIHPHTVEARNWLLLKMNVNVNINGGII